MQHSPDFQLQCPIPLSDYPRVTLAHGGGGKLTHQLIAEMFAPMFDNEFLRARHDGAVLPMDGERIAFTTDSHVIQPLFFPGGDIGSLAVYGTVNDLAMCGARPLYLSLSLIIEEGLPMQTLWKVVQSIKTACERAGVKIVAGDTKVIERQNGDELFINTSGVGVIEHNLDIRPGAIHIGDRIIINGDLGLHGIAVLAQRQGLEFETTIDSDCAPLNGLVGELLRADISIHCMRDLTRGGLAGALVEIAGTAKKHISIDETKITVREDVQGACEILGFDPLFVANEGRFVLFLPPDETEKALAVMHKHPLGAGAAVIGLVDEGAPGVAARNDFGGSRVVEMFSGEQLPRIC